MDRCRDRAHPKNGYSPHACSFRQRCRAADAIIADTDPDAEKWVAMNTKYAAIWPVLLSSKEPLPDADDHDGTPNKFETLFSEAPAAQA